MCSLDESWALAYFQVAVLILIFGIGIPSLVLQTIISEDLRRIVDRHSGLLKWAFLLIIGFMLIALTFVWIIHPCDTNQSGLLATLGLNTSQWIAGGIISIAIIAIGVVWYLYALHRSKGILDILKRKCEQDIRHKGVPDESALEDVRYLGEQAKTGREKIRVLRVLELLATKVQNHKRYEGNSLGDIIEAIEFTLLNQANYQSFDRGILRLIRIIEALQNSKIASPADMGSVLRALRRLGKFACTMESVRPALKVLEAIELASRGPGFSEAALAFFELGAVALEQKSYLVARASLSKLEAMTWPKQPLDAKTSAAYVGLLAHFWVEGGSGQQCVRSSLKNIKLRRRCLIEAQELHYKAARFDTADKLADMIVGLKRKNRKSS